MTHFASSFISMLLLLYCGITSLEALAKTFYRGECALENDPELVKPPTLSICTNGEFNSWLVQTSNGADTQQPPILHRLAMGTSVYMSPWVSLHLDAYTNLLLDRATKYTVIRDSRTKVAGLQLGNNALSRHRFVLAKGVAPYRINHDQRAAITTIFGLDSIFDPPPTQYATYTYDNKLDWIFQASYGRVDQKNLNERQRTFSSMRAMYDFAALEGTRITIGGFGDGLLRRAANIGILNINGAGDETALEFTRRFSLNPYDPHEFKQQIRLSYVSHVQDGSRIKFQYDDIFQKWRIGGFGSEFNLNPHTILESHFGFAKSEIPHRKSFYFVSLSGGLHI